MYVREPDMFSAMSIDFDPTLNFALPGVNFNSLAQLPLSRAVIITRLRVSPKLQILVRGEGSLPALGPSTCIRKVVPKNPKLTQLPPYLPPFFVVAFFMYVYMYVCLYVSRRSSSQYCMTTPMTMCCKDGDTIIQETRNRADIEIREHDIE